MASTKAILHVSMCELSLHKQDVKMSRLFNVESIHNVSCVLCSQHSVLSTILPVM